MSVQINTVNLLLETRGGSREKGGAAWLVIFFFLLAHRYIFLGFSAAVWQNFKGINWILNAIIRKFISLY